MAAQCMIPYVHSSGVVSLTGCGRSGDCLSFNNHVSQLVSWCFKPRQHKRSYQEWKLKLQSISLSFIPQVIMPQVSFSQTTTPIISTILDSKPRKAIIPIWNLSIFRRHSTIMWDTNLPSKTSTMWTEIAIILHYPQWEDLLIGCKVLAVFSSASQSQQKRKKQYFQLQHQDTWWYEIFNPSGTEWNTVLCQKNALKLNEYNCLIN